MLTNKFICLQTKRLLFIYQISVDFPNYSSKKSRISTASVHKPVSISADQQADSKISKQTKTTKLKSELHSKKLIIIKPKLENCL